MSAPCGARSNIWNATGAAITAMPRPTSTHRAGRAWLDGVRRWYHAMPAAATISAPGTTKNHGNIGNGGNAATAA